MRFFKLIEEKRTGRKRGVLCQFVIESKDFDPQSLISDRDSAEGAFPEQEPVSEPERVSARAQVSHAERASHDGAERERASHDGAEREPVSARERASHDGAEREPERASHDGAEREPVSEPVRASHDGAEPEPERASEPERDVSADGHGVRAMRFRNKVRNRKE